MNPGGVGTSTQNLFTTTNKMATSLAATKGGQIVQNTMSKSLEKVLNPKYAGAAQRVTQYTLNGAVAGSLHSTSLSLIQNKSSGEELLEASLWGGAFGGAFGALGGMLSPVLGKVFTAARQYTSKLKPNQIIANLKQSMKQRVVTGNPLAANPIRKGLETKGYKPKPGERTTTKEQYKAQEHKKREALREGRKPTPKEVEHAKNRASKVLDDYTSSIKDGSMYGSDIIPPSVTSAAVDATAPTRVGFGGSGIYQSNPSIKNVKLNNTNEYVEYYRKMLTNDHIDELVKNNPSNFAGKNVDSIKEEMGKLQMIKHELTEIKLMKQGYPYKILVHTILTRIPLVLNLQEHTTQRILNLKVSLMGRLAIILKNKVR
ncbi:hypothetical protein ABEW50_20790 [Paenibacillus jamilae]|uniref:Uncharacterized protein n=1 Tax=Paenibacillus alvei TaxID=44250 RepID=A0ABT4E781_PAEAL|nr:hypothetical protein [Paenibacillus alvei]MCY9529465.1 hypothetical protein [Paenibacillus alvei]